MIPSVDEYAANLQAQGYEIESINGSHRDNRLLSARPWAYPVQQLIKF
jgi:hypothetical protein